MPLSLGTCYCGRLTPVVPCNECFRRDYRQPEPIVYKSQLDAHGQRVDGLAQHINWLQERIGALEASLPAPRLSGSIKRNEFPAGTTQIKRYHTPQKHGGGGFYRTIFGRNICTRCGFDEFEEGCR